MAVGIVVVSHSRPLAEAALGLAAIMLVDESPPVAIAAGAGDGFGTDATAVMAAIEEVRGADGVAIFVDMGSAVLSTQVALDLLGAGDDVRVLAAPLVEGLTAGLVRAATGGSLDEVARAAESAMDAKYEALGRTPQRPTDGVVDGPAELTAEVRLVNSIGLHARPAARLASLVTQYDAEMRVAFGQKLPVNAKSTMSLMALGAKQGDTLRIEADGPQADEALAAVVAFVESGLGDVL
ncbi:MAG: HPr family phosphocarrier protein [Propionibacterium sp.]|nr:HPr family phosphocarrier protein [Propionibacterium sp.]